MNTKKCIDCCNELPADNFSFKNKSKNILQPRCKPCYNAYNRKYYQSGEKTKQIERVRANAKQRYDLFKEWRNNQSCLVCGEHSPECLDLHHIDPSQKEGTISELFSRWSWTRIQEEINKCIVVCSNCHRKIHSGTIQYPTVA
jgi:hypothetical protein